MWYRVICYKYTYVSGISSAIFRVDGCDDVSSRILRYSVWYTSTSPYVVMSRKTEMFIVTARTTSEMCISFISLTALEVCMSRLFCSDPDSGVLGSVPEYRWLTRESGSSRLVRTGVCRQPSTVWHGIITPCHLVVSGPQISSGYYSFIMHIFP
jgi:hypothetical protein